MAKQPVLTPAVQHIVRNFNIFGFGNEESALLQSIKELVENSIDACKSQRILGRSHGIAIHLCSSPSSSAYIELEVSDDGCGMCDPSSVLKCFTTHKDFSDSTTTGRFGVGLSTCLIYSLVNTGVPMRIVTKGRADSGCTVADFSLDSSGSPVCVQSRNIEVSNLLGGTKVRVTLLLSEHEAKKVLQRVSAATATYLNRIEVNPTNFVEFDFTVHYADWTFTHHTAAPDPVSASIVLQSPSLFSSQNSKHVQRLLPAHRGVAGSGAALVEADGLQVAVAVCLTAAVVTATPAAAGAPSLAPITTAVLPLRLWRYANHVPLLETGDDALSCASATALRSVKWTNYGLKLKLSLDEGAEHTSTGEESENAPPGTSNEAEFDCAQGPSWQLQVQRPDTQLAVHMQQLQVLLTVDVIGTNVPFANMRKTALGSDRAALGPLLTTGIHAALACVEKQEGALGIFRSKEEYKRRLVQDKYLPSVASSLTRIVASSKEAEYVDWAQDLLGMEATAADAGGVLMDPEGMRARIEELLQGVVANSYCWER